MSATKDICKAFTIDYNRLSSRLNSSIIVEYVSKTMDVCGLWDTGATMSCISHEVVSTLSLIPVGRGTIQTPSGSKEVDIHLVDFILPNGVGIKGVRVYETDIGDQGIGALIGMDIISRGDFTVTNYNGSTVFTFRMPSMKVVDYVKQINAQNAIGAKHGKGKRRR